MKIHMAPDRSGKFHITNNEAEATCFVKVDGRTHVKDYFDRAECFSFDGDFIVATMRFTEHSPAFYSTYNPECFKKEGSLEKFREMVTEGLFVDVRIPKSDTEGFVAYWANAERKYLRDTFC